VSAAGRKYFGDLGAVRAGHEVNVHALHDFFREAVPGYVGPLSLKQFEGGQSNPTYLVETPSRAYVLRRRPFGALLPSAHQIDREFRVIAAVRETQFPAPEPIAYCAEAERIGAAFFVMSYVPGRIFFDCKMPDLSCDERAAVYDSANETLARLHSFDPGALGLSDFGRPGNYFERQIGRWSKQYVASRTQDIPEMERLMEWLSRAIPPSEDTRLIHGDYSFHNLLFDTREPKVVAVIDWELSTTGDPIGDLMYHAMEWYRPIDSDLRGSLAGTDPATLGIPRLEDYIKRYCDRANRNVPDNLGFYRAYNLFRVAAIVQGIVARAREGNASSATAAEQGPRVRVLAAAAWREAQEAGAT
jgi:aminoglycoside phosphotransferase (APT) family kinase protein